MGCSLFGAADIHVRISAFAQEQRPQSVQRVAAFLEMHLKRPMHGPDPEGRSLILVNLDLSSCARAR